MSQEINGIKKRTLEDLASGLGQLKGAIDFLAVVIEETESGSLPDLVISANWVKESKRNDLQLVLSLLDIYAAGEREKIDRVILLNSAKNLAGEFMSLEVQDKWTNHLGARIQGQKIDSINVLRTVTEAAKSDINARPAQRESSGIREARHLKAHLVAQRA